ncbi:MAG: hypothetical protein WD688_23445 [Candidatus Binatia bacterium]
MKLLVRNPLIVTMNEDNDVIENGAMVVAGNRLAYVGPAEWTPPGPFDRTIDASRMIAMPGMVNSHCHSPANLVRGMMPSKPLEIWRACYRASLRDMRDLGLRHVVALTLSDKNYEETIPLGNTAADLDNEIKRMSQSEDKPTKAWLDDCEAFIDTFHAPEKLTTACPGPSAVQSPAQALTMSICNGARVWSRCRYACAGQACRRYFVASRYSGVHTAQRREESAGFLREWQFR